MRNDTAVPKAEISAGSLAEIFLNRPPTQSQGYGDQPKNLIVSPYPPYVSSMDQLSDEARADRLRTRKLGMGRQGW